MSRRTSHLARSWLGGTWPGSGQARLRPGSYSGDDTVNLMTKDVMAVSLSLQCHYHGSVPVTAVSLSQQSRCFSIVTVMAVS
jgi:hypothetical protein